MFKHAMMNAAKQTSVMLAAALLTAIAAGCAKPLREQQPAPAAKTAAVDELNAAARDVSDYLNGSIPKGNKIVILNIQSCSPVLSDYIIDELIANAVNDRVFTVADRRQLDAIRDEQKFQMSGAVDDKDALEIGKFFGAQTIVSGALSSLGAKYRLTIRALDVQTASVQGQYNRNIDSSAVINSLIPDCAAQTPAEPARQALETKPVRHGTKGTDFRDGKIGIEMVFVAGGTFRMGCADEKGGCYDNEGPTRNVTLSDFYIGKHEISQKQWKEVMGSNPVQHGTADNHPVYNLSWNEIQDFISELNIMTGKKYRLPTEAEWEYAARGGNKGKGYPYSGSGDIDLVAWHQSNSAGVHPVGVKLPNELGIHDMSGNVWELVNDRYGDYTTVSQTDPAGPDSGSERAFRGGSWNNGDCRVFSRDGHEQGARGNLLGFRLALDP